MRHSIPMLLWLLLLGIDATKTRADDQSQPTVDGSPFLTVRLLDEQGEPIAGAKAGQWIISSESKDKASDDRNYKFGDVSDSQGIVRFREGAEHFEVRPVVIARHSERHLMGVRSFSPSPPGDTIDITLRPECHVQMKISSSQLQSLGRDIGRLNGLASFDGKLCSFSLFDGSTFHAFLPPGKFSLQIMGSNVNSATREFEIKTGERSLELGPLDLTAKQFILLEGMPAPEFDDVIVWKNGPPVRLADLRGKFVLLEFWGWWCGPCVHRGIPELFRLQDEFAGKDLAIIGIHVPASETDDVDSVARLDDKLGAVRKDVWKGRDITFPVALTRTAMGSFTPDEPEFAGSKMSFAYGVDAFPTSILIDREGKILGRFRPHFEPDLDRLRKLLNSQ